MATYRPKLVGAALFDGRLTAGIGTCGATPLAYPECIIDPAGADSPEKEVRK